MNTDSDISVAQEMRLALAEMRDEFPLSFPNTVTVNQLDIVPIPVFGKDATGCYTLANQAFLDLLNVRREEVLGKTVFELNSWGLAATYHAKDQELLKRGGRQVYAAQVVVSKGETRDVVFHKAAIQKADGEVVGIIGAVQDITERRAIERELESLTHQLERSMSGVIELLGRVQEQRDPYTVGHQKRVADLSVAIAEKLGINPAETEVIRIGALIHDIGKVRVPPELLTKPGHLSKVEFALVKSHSEAGKEILAGTDLPSGVVDIVIQHHERCDGSGYPNGLNSTNICLGAKIVGVADVIEAVTSHRPYRPAKGLDHALGIVRSGMGAAFDPEIVRACTSVIEGGAFNWAESASL